MSASFHESLEFLCSAQDSAARERRSLGAMISTRATDQALSMLGPAGCPYSFAMYVHLLEEVQEAASRISKEKSVADWPFENFWHNPYEPAHSKLLGYFIDPKEDHGCGSFLLACLLKVLSEAVPEEDRFPTNGEGCEVAAESRSEHGQVDLRITRTRNPRKYTIIIENKINRAVNQRNQLANYVRDAEIKRGFQGKREIYVFFLPLLDDLEPDATDRREIEENGRATYVKVTFDEHIRSWLKLVLNTSWEPGFEPRIKEHLDYYSHLIDYLVKKAKVEAMDIEILSKLRVAYQTKNGLPSLAGVVQLRADAETLERCLRNVLRGKLLLNVCNLLPEACLCEEDWPRDVNAKDDPFDPQFQRGVNVCIDVSPMVAVCFGCNNEQAWYGYMSKEATKTDDIESCVQSEVARLSNSKGGGNSGWYAWFDEKTRKSELANHALSLNNLEDALLPGSISETLLKMQTGLLEALRIKVQT